MNEYVTRSEWNEMKTILERIEAKLESHDRYFIAINSTFTAIDLRFVSIDRRFDRLEEQVHHQGILYERLEWKLDAINEGFATKASQSTVDALAAKVDTLEIKVDSLEAKVDVLDAKIDAVDIKLSAKLDEVIELVRKR